MRLYCGHSLNNTIYHTRRPNDCQPQFDVVWAVSFIGLFYMDKISGIYKITNSINNKYYIGSSYDIYYRWRKHRELLKRNDHHSPKLQRSWNRDGEAVFDFTIIELCDRKELIEKEQSYLCIAKKEKKQSYNMTFDATRPEDRYGHKHPCWIKVSKKTREVLQKYWLKNSTMKTILFAKKKYGLGSKIICNRLIPIFKKQIKERPERSWADKTIYMFYHKDGRTYTGKRINFIKRYELTECCISNMIAGRFKSHKGWSLIKNLQESDKSGLKNSNCDKNLYLIYNVFTKEKIIDTRYNIYTVRKTINKDALHALIHKKYKQTKCGWTFYDSRQNDQ